MPGPYYASYTEKSTTPLFKIGSAEKFAVPNTDDYVKLIPRKYIDVRSDFSWTVSPKKQVLDKIPAMYLVERELQQNSLISSALYYLNAITSSTLTDLTAENIADKVTSILVKIDPELGGSGASALDKFNKFRVKIRDLAATSNDQSILSDRLKSYIGIYFTQPTGFKYVLPYLDNTFIKQRNSFAGTQQAKGLFSGVVTDTLMPAIDTLAASGNIFTPGTFIEKPKYFQYPTESEGDTFTVTFPLLNTFNSNNLLPYVQNYELLWILSYQNKPYRTSFSRILPPKLYSVYIPGIKFLPYAYISDMTVDFVGNRRRLELTLPTGSVVKAPIPDAYSVSITFTSLLASIGNNMVDEQFNSDVIEVRVI